MIEFLVSWAEQLIITLIIIIMVEMIIPNSSYRKYIKIILGIFMLYTIFNPIIGKKIDNINFKEAISEDLNEANYINNETSLNYENQIEIVYKEKMKESISQYLKEKGYEVVSIDTEVEYKNENIIVNKLQMKIKKGENTENKTIEKVIISDQRNIEKDEFDSIKEEISNTYNIQISKISIESENIYD